MAQICSKTESRIDYFINHFQDEFDADGNEITDGDMLDRAYTLLKDIQNELKGTKK